MCMCLCLNGGNFYYLLQKISSVVTICVDLSDVEATQQQLESVGPVHLLVNNAAVSDMQPFIDVTPDTYDR